MVLSKYVMKELSSLDSIFMDYMISFNSSQWLNTEVSWPVYEITACSLFPETVREYSTALRINVTIVQIPHWQTTKETDFGQTVVKEVYDKHICISKTK